MRSAIATACGACVPTCFHALVRREDIACSALVDRERQTRRDEVAIDLEDRSSKKGTPPQPTEAGDIRDLRRTGGHRPPSQSPPAPMVE